MIDAEKYVVIFQKAADNLNKKRLTEMQLEIAVGEILDAVYLKIYKRSWASPGEDALKATSRIFFSIWVNDAATLEQKIFYNIHAFKLRLLKGYRIESRKFADQFRDGFKQYEQQWQNVSTSFGPLTLMEGWIEMDSINIQHSIEILADNFFEIAPLIDDTLAKFK